MAYNFLETKLDSDFCLEQINAIKKLIEDSQSFTLSGMPGVGGSIFLRFLAIQTFANFTYIDTYQLSDISRVGYYQLLLKELGITEIPEKEQQILEVCRERLKELAQKHHRIVFILNRFDQLHDIFSQQLFTDLMSFKNVDLEKIIFIFTGNKPYIETLPDGISADVVNHLFAKTIYLKPYSENDLLKLLKITNNASIHTDEFIQKAIYLSGGHYQLLQLFLKSERLEPPFIDHFVKFQLKEIYNYLNYSQKKIIQKIALGKSVESIDPYLLGVGIIKENDCNFELFTPLFAQFINNNISPKMSKKELRLFKLLKNHLGTTVYKETIFQEVWEGEQEAATDWGLTSLIYRLRKHPLVTGQNYIIENHKKLGYIMIKD